MDGLEAVEIKLSMLERTHRIDSEFFKKTNILIDKTLKGVSTKSFEQYFCISDGNHMSISNEFVDCGVPYYRGQDIYNLFIENATPIGISEKAYHYTQMQRSHLKKGDVLMSIVGAIIGNSSIVSTNNKATCSCKLAILRARNKDVSPEILLLYIKSIFGQNQIQKYKRGTAQTGFLLEDFEQIRIPIFSIAFQKKTAAVVLMIQKYVDMSKLQYLNAQAYLYTNLDVTNQENHYNNIAIKSLSDSFAHNSRLDAEYYQPKFDQLLQGVTKYNPRRLSGANGLVTIKKSIEPGSDYYGSEGVPFVRISNLSKYEISESDIKISFDTVNDIESLYPKKDTILLSKDGSVGIAYKVEQDMECVTSGAILHLTVNNTDEILPEYLTLVLNSKVVQMQAERDAGGSIIQHWKPSEIADVVIPVLDMDKQIEISEKIKESFALRRKSKELLELAKIAIEVAIEQGEDIAMKMLEEIDDE